MAYRPYRGLSFYEEDDESIFAGREREVEQCYHLLMTSHILLLHGKTGCGKSSFLRAGLAPFLKQREALKFAERDNRALFVRSGANPLRQLASGVWDLIVEANKTDDEVKNAMLGRLNSRDYSDHVVNDYLRLIDSLGILAENLACGLVLIIDQTEEIFTLADRYSPDETTSKVVTEYYRFLARMSMENAGVRLCLTLRTEYKGLLDDQLVQFGANQAAIEGYYLSELDQDRMLEVIQRPTKYQNFNFSFEPRVPERIVRSIEPLSGEIPIGGRLPVLQVMCLRLWKTITEENRNRITESDFLNLGRTNRQIEYYIEEALREILWKTVLGGRPEIVHRLGEEIDKWRSVLLKLCLEESDGRVVSEQETVRDLLEAAQEKECEGNPDQCREVLDRLAGAEVGLLRSVRSEVEGEGNKLALIHDAVGLALVRWHTSRPDRHGSPSEGSDFERDHLFGTEKLREYTVYTIDDPIWDHRIHLFADRMKFTRRLGFSICFASRKEIRWRSEMDSLPGQLKTLAGRPDQSFLYSLPLETMNHIGREKDGWLQLIIPDLYHAFALIGPAELLTKGGVPLRVYGKLLRKDEATVTAWMSELAHHLRERPISILDDAAQKFLEAVLEVVGVTPSSPVSASSGDILSVLKSGGFVIGSANERAIAERADFQCYLNGDHIPQIIDILHKSWTINRRIRLIRSSEVHNVWNLKAAGNISDYLAFRLRLASIGFYTCEYIREHPERFAQFLWSTDTGSRHEGHWRLDQSSIRSAVASSYRFAAFDEYGRDFLDKSSFNSLSDVSGKALETYYDLLDLRRTSIEKAGKIDKLCEGELPNNLRELKLRAWRHFQILNFFDSDRLFTDALSLLQGR
jgi:hypothetical protein